MLKNYIKKFPGFSFLLKIKNDLEFYYDKKIFKKNFMYSRPVTKKKLEYDMLFEVHKLEKGFAITNNLRPFGFDKVKRIMKDITDFEKYNFEKSFAYHLAYSSLEEYLKFYEEKKWNDKEEYILVKEFMNNPCNYDHILVGAFDLKKDDFYEDIIKFDFDRLLSTRRSIRNFSKKELESDDIKKAVQMAIKTPTACNRQMCKIYYINKSNNKLAVEKYAQGLGLFDLTNANYFIITFDLSANYFVGERNQGWFNSGLVTMNFVNALHSLGIGSCCIQFGNSFKQEKELKKILNISESERIAVIITAGYYDSVSRIPYSSRKPLNEIYCER